MQALWLEHGDLRLRDDVRVPDVPPGEALVRVRLAGICNTDLELVKGYYPFVGIPGHEFVGEVIRAPGADHWIGRRTVGEINATCGACPQCTSGRRTHCERRTVLGIVNRHGAFAEYLTLPVDNLHEVPDAMPDHVAVFAEPVAAAFEILEQIALGAQHRVVVIGDGKLGQVIAQVLALTGCNLVVLGRHTRKLAHLNELGIRTAAASEPPPRQADVVVECTGNPDGLQLAKTLVRPRGTIVLKSTYRGETTINASSLVVDEVTLIGSRCGPFIPALDALRAGRVSVRPLIDAQFPLIEGLQAFEKAAQPGVLKVLLSPASPQCGSSKS